ncbi:LVIVD repeat-containing protein [Rhodohalobacter sp. 8-1]|uniref:LVIVD repeat-containing protein n=1 Tax=Rhodohalobacter sp. 8-1 TaxID=3131972 RepID=UPI0030EE6362
MTVFFKNIIASLAVCLLAVTVQAQDITIQFEPSEPILEVGEELQLKGKAVDAEGNVLSEDLRFFSRARNSVGMSRDGLMTAMYPGTFTVSALYTDDDNNRVIENLEVTINYPPLESITFTNVPDRMYTNTALQVDLEVMDEAGLTREAADVTFSVNNSLANIDRFGLLQLQEPGLVTLTASAENIETTTQLRIVENPVRSVAIGNEVMEARTGDVLRINATALDSDGNVVADAPVEYSFIARPDDTLGQSAEGQVAQDGRFVANLPGYFTLIAKSGNSVARQTVRINERNIKMRLEMVGHSLVNSVHTSDLWVWEGQDGRDYAITGTWGGSGDTYFWDVTDPANMVPIDTVTVDARTVNDVKISDDGSLAVITREGASNRRNGIVIMDVSDPHNVSIISEYTEDLTGGVHNSFIYENHVYAVNNGRKYDIINIDDPANPYTVSQFELDTPGHAIHDVWIEDGIAYSSNWSDGIVMTDVGSTPEAKTPEGHELGVGSPSNPVKLGQYSYPSGWNHAAFPFKSESTGDFYVIAGDEAFPSGINIENEPTVPAGWLHFVKFDGWENPEEVARYEIPEAGTHNYWVDGDLLYIAYYNAGLRIVDISGELMGNLYDQGREIAHYITTDHEGYVPNAAMAWGPQPHKEHIFVSDWNSGIWSFRLVED